MRSFISIIFLIITLVSCDEPYTIEPQQTTPIYVIEGLLTDEFTQHYVRVTRTADFYSTGSTPAVSAAQVMVSDSEGNVFNYVEQEDDLGLYRSQEAFSGQTGVTYSMSVTLGNETFTASEELLRVTPIDSMIYRIDQDRKDELVKYPEDFDEDEKERYYEVLMYTKEPQETVDYYLFKFYRNGEINNYDGQDVYYADDVVIQENISGISANDWYKRGDVARFEMFSLTREAFLYYADLDITLNNDGGLFSPLPTNPRTNISGGAMGLFQVSGLAAGELTIE